MAEAQVEAAFEALYVELRYMAEKLRKGEEIDLYRALEIIGLIDRNVSNTPWKGHYHYCKDHIRAAAKKKGII